MNKIGYLRIFGKSVLFWLAYTAVFVVLDFLFFHSSFSVRSGGEFWFLFSVKILIFIFLLIIFKILGFVRGEEKPFVFLNLLGFITVYFLLTQGIYFLVSAYYSSTGSLVYQIIRFNYYFLSSSSSTLFDLLLIFAVTRVVLSSEYFIGLRKRAIFFILAYVIIVIADYLYVTNPNCQDLCGLESYVIMYPFLNFVEDVSLGNPLAFLTVGTTINVVLLSLLLFPKYQFN